MLGRPTGQHVENVRVSDGSHFNATTHNHTYNGIERTLFEMLSPVSQAFFNSSTNEYWSCLEGTRTEVLGEIRRWIDGDESPIFWLNGIAGSGKSAIAKTIAEELDNSERPDKSKRLGASFFFKHDQKELSSSRKFVPTIAYQLACCDEQLKTTILKVARAQPDIVEKSRKEQWKQLIVQPLNRLQKTADRETWFIVVDALDECDNDDDITGLVAILAEVERVQTIKLRVIITSRPEPPIPMGFRMSGPEIRHYDLLLHDVPRKDVDADISLFYTVQFGTLKARWELQDEWPLAEQIKQLVTAAAGLFIFAATVCRYVAENDHPEGLFLFLSEGAGVLGEQPRGPHDSSSRPYWKLDEMYERILGRCASKLPNSTGRLSIGTTKEVIAAIAVLKQPLSVRGLAQLLGLGPGDTKVRASLSKLRSVVRVPANGEDPVRFHHESFRDFLFDAQRSSESGFTVDRQEIHGRLLSCCLRAMQRGLRQNICGLTGPGIRVSEIAVSRIAELLPTSVQYACQYWVHHCCEAEIEPDSVLQFLHDHLLHWIEAMSLMGRVAEAIHMIVQLQQKFTRAEASNSWGAIRQRPVRRSRRLMMDGSKDDRCETSKKPRNPDDDTDAKGSGPISAFLRDARRVLLLGRAGIEQAPMQVYEAALSFAPTTSLVRQHFLPRVIQLMQRFGECDHGHEWDACVQVLAGDNESVGAMAFAPDGLRLASVSDDGIIRFWETATGRCMQIFEQSGWCGAIAFTPDSRFLASAVKEGDTSPQSDRYKVLLWETATGRCVQELFHKDEIFAMAFSPDGHTLATGSMNGDGMIWEVASGRCLQHMKTDHPVHAVAFTPDGHLLVIGQHIFDLKRERCVRRLEHLPEAIFFMQDSQRMMTIGITEDRQEESATHHRYGILQIFETAIGDNVQTLCHEELLGDEYAFAPDGRLLATARLDTVKIWDVPTSRCVHKLHVLSISCNPPVLAFAPDSRTLALGLPSGEVQIWDLKSEQRVPKVPIHLDERGVYSLAFAPDGKMFASASADVQIWETATGRCIRESIGPYCAEHVAFSPDGEKLAAQDSSGITVHSVADGELLQWLDHSRLWLDSFRYSSDGTQLEATDFRGRCTWPLNSRAASTPASRDGADSGHNQDPINISKSWLVVDDVPLICLPPRFNDVKCHARHGDVIVLGHKSDLMSVWKVRATSYEGLTDVEMEDI